jgi:hypothetical protein
MQNSSTPDPVRRVYVAGYFQTRVTSALPDWILESYYYIREGQVPVEMIRERGCSIFMDSGAYSAYTKKITIDLSEYAAYLAKHPDLYHLAASLDLIGRGRERENYSNLKRLESYGAKVLPVHHVWDHDDWLRRILDEGYDHICLGGMVGKPTGSLRFWLDRIFDRFLLNSDNTPKVRVHGFGLTQLDLMLRYPFSSVDSTTWVLTGRYGQIYYDHPNRERVHKIAISSDSSRRRTLDEHFDTLHPISQERIRSRIESLGFDVEKMRTDYAERDRWNIEYFRRCQYRPCDMSWRDWASMNAERAEDFVREREVEAASSGHHSTAGPANHQPEPTQYAIDNSDLSPRTRSAPHTLLPVLPVPRTFAHSADHT